MGHESICILWDDSHIWGIMAWRAMRAFGLSCCLLKAKEIAQGALLGKGASPERPILLVPGGSARLKAAALGQKGRAAIRQWLAGGGVYLGFCGGAGLALCQGNEGNGGYGLDICPWTRAAYPQRLLHLLSGHVLALGAAGEKLSLPVWWPGRFAENQDEPVRVLARYAEPGPDLWLADMPLARVPERILAMWKDKCGFDARLGFPAGQPLVAGGSFGKGAYILSYAHLETPGSAQANAWLCGMLEEMAGLAVKNAYAPAWDAWPQTGTATAFSGGLGNAWEENVALAMARALSEMGRLLRTGEEIGIFFRRAPWLWGWRAGIAGMACNNLLAALATLAELEPTRESLSLWRTGGKNFLALFKTFIDNAEAGFWAWRLERTMDAVPQGMVPGVSARPLLADLFGHPMLGGGLARELLAFLEELIFLSQDRG